MFDKPALTADKTLEEPPVETPETEEPEVEEPGTQVEPAEKPEEKAEKPKEFLIDVGDIRFRDKDAIVQSIQNARTELIRRSRENREKDGRIAELTAHLSRLDVQLKKLSATEAVRPEVDASEDPEELVNKLEVNGDLDYAEYQKQVKDTLRAIAKSSKAAASQRQAKKEPEPAPEMRVEPAPQPQESLAARHILAECEALQVEHPEFYDFDPAKFNDIMDDPFHPDRDKVTNIIEVARLMGDGLTAEKAHMVVGKRLEKKRGPVSVPPVVTKKPEPKSPEEEVLRDLRRGRESVASRPLPSGPETTKKATSLSEALREMNEQYRGM